MGAIVGVVVVLFGIFWTIGASNMSNQMKSHGFPGGGSGIAEIFPLFGVLFVIVAICGVIYNVVNAGSRNRMSQYDITSHREESDPLNKIIAQRHPVPPTPVRKAPVTSQPTAEARLAQLEKLRAQGLISEEEHAAQRQRVLNEI